MAQRGRHLNYRIRVGSFDEQCRLVSRGAGLALMPRSAAERHARTLDIAIIALADDFANIALCLCVRRLDELPTVTRRLVGSLLGSVAPPALQWQAPGLQAEHPASRKAPSGSA